jgi:cytochrome c-type biogenesis protein
VILSQTKSKKYGKINTPKERSKSMQYFISFLEGIITFISPCLLPMLPIYVSYFAGGEEERSTAKTLKNAIGFVIGFTAIFVLLGALAGTLGSFLKKYQLVVNIVTGLVVVLFGLNFLGLFKLNIFRGGNGPLKNKKIGFFSALLFGVVFSIGWTPCVGAFLGSALMMASQEGNTLKGIAMLLCYSLGLGIPFVASAVLIDKLRSTFNFIKKHYNVINTVSGILLILLGILMMTGLLGRFLTILS